MTDFSRRAFLLQSPGLALSAGVAGSYATAADPPEPIQEYSRGGMVYRRLGHSDLYVSLLSFGSHTNAAFKRRDKHGSDLTEKGQALRDRRIAKAFDLGVNMVDTYENAGQWNPMARLVRTRRDKVLVSICRQFPDFVGRNIEAAARLFGHVDLYRIYVGDGPAVSERTLEDWDVMRKAKTAGTVRAIGISTHSERMMLSALEELEGLDYIMFPYNFIHARADYSQFLPTAVKEVIGLIAIKPLAAGSIVKLDPRAHPESKAENPQTQLYRERNRAMLPAVVAKLTRSLNRLPDETLCQAALRFVYARSFITSAMPGMFQEHELTQNYDALKRHVELSQDERAALDAARTLSTVYGQNWLPPHYRWLDERWRV
ncbi:MAG: aldo/keto reductase [Planctomycetes bacterium]|nr:aldo/keto reductase [Planctomycetota bacterium]MBL7036988.1 aldo/keto reductase [Pirellulaceae bacterium]